MFSHTGNSLKYILKVYHRYWLRKYELYIYIFRQYQWLLMSSTLMFEVHKISVNTSTSQNVILRSLMGENMITLIQYKRLCHYDNMMTSSNANIFRVTGHFLRGIHWSPVNSPRKGQWCGALMFSLIYVWINGWINNREAGDLRRYRTHYDIIVRMLVCMTMEAVMRKRFIGLLFNGTYYILGWK